MYPKTIIRCPNCGGYAQRFLSDRLPLGVISQGTQVLQTECSHCDYLMVMCSSSGRVYLPSSVVTTSSPSKKYLGQDLLAS
ncbi:hypothetical protein Lepto7376_1124 [[Leptolyngbya] sp. PCC 7376]|uniref:hypothetical protein n=1 Tax=[Leptolyngbya] sp. PCC 7376 TaxID=111781 RepID=UPI00029F0ECC|nr:hypothetical protein [[Leptolyngbya] sp. PCC 7376]AFY37491.1 hypothetical protein Lepto7376_1124 [[Leptolyngbya] sp. PCC 7376]